MRYGGGARRRKHRGPVAAAAHVRARRLCTAGDGDATATSPTPSQQRLRRAATSVRNRGAALGRGNARVSLHRHHARHDARHLLEADQLLRVAAVGGGGVCQLGLHVAEVVQDQRLERRDVALELVHLLLQLRCSRWPG